MEYGAIDLHLRRSHIRIVDEHEQVVLHRRVDTTPADAARSAVTGAFRACSVAPLLRVNPLPPQPQLPVGGWLLDAERY
jgi:hypothetical protein